MNPIDKSPVKGQENVEVTHNQNPDLEKIRYYRGTWKNFFDYWNRRGVETDPYQGVELKYPDDKVQKDATMPYQDYGTFNKSKGNKLHESFEEFLNDEE